MLGEQRKTAVALGNFDGVHLGHRKVLEAVAEKSADGFLPYAVVFNVHPQKILNGKAPPALCVGRIRDKLFEDLGVSIHVLDFLKVRNMEARDFFIEILIKTLNVSFISCGYDYGFGAGSRGDAALLKSLCKEFHVELHVAGEVTLRGIRVSSTNIRKALIEGKLELANAMLGREFSYNFVVVSGDRRGRLLGAPTINQFFPDDFTVPKYGVYASRAFARGEWYPAVTNIGLRPTVGDDKPRSETCMLGFDGDLYGKNIEVRLVKYLRPEIKFASFDELSAQIKADAAEALRIMNGLDGRAHDIRV